MTKKLFVLYRVVAFALTLVVLISATAVSAVPGDAGAQDSQEILMSETNKQEINSFAEVVEEKTQVLSEMKKISENKEYELHVNLENGEFAVIVKKTGHIWWSNPLGKDDDKKAKDIWKTSLKSQIIYERTNNAGKIDERHNSFLASYKKGGLKVTQTDGGFRADYNFVDQKVTIPLEVKLHDNYLSAFVPINEIINNNEDLLIKNITLLPFFGAANEGDNGYMLVPDGSGALINLNNNKAIKEPLRIPVYGDDDSIPSLTKTNVKQTAHLPVFGMKKGDNAFLGVVHESAAISEIMAYVSGMTSSYNTTYASFKLRTIDTYQITDRSGKLRNIPIIDKSPLKYNKLEVRYYFTDNEHADYNGMAKAYQLYLMEEKGATGKKIKDDSGLYLDLYGGVLKKKSFLGMPVEATQVLTDYKGAGNIIKEYKNAGIDDFIIRYRNVAKQDINKRSTDKFSFNSKIGGKKEYRRLLSVVGEGNIYTSVDPVNVTGYGWIFSTMDATVKTPGQLPAYQYSYHLAHNFVDKERPRWYLLSPGVVASQLEKYIRNSSKNEYGKQIAIDEIGERIYSDYGKSKMNRVETETVWTQSLKTNESAGASLMFSGGNSYVIPYADRIVNVPTSGSGYVLTDVEIPFIQLVMNGLVNYSTQPINLSSNPHRSLLQAIESGSSLHYALIHEEPSLMMETELQWLYSGDYKKWMSTIVDHYHRYKMVRDKVDNSKIIDHKILKSGLTETVYENGISVIVNYNKQDEAVDGMIIPTMDFKILNRKEAVK